MSSLMKSRMKNNQMILVYTDGSCYQGVGGYGAVVIMGDKKKTFFSSKRFTNTTSNRMEARAILAAIKHIKPGYHVNIFTDSQYCQKMFSACLHHTDVNRLREFKNYDLWSEIYEALQMHQKHKSVMSISWVRAHDGNLYNEEADRLASKGKNQHEIQECQDEETYNKNKGTYARSKKFVKNRKFSR